MMLEKLGLDAEDVKDCRDDNPDWGIFKVQEKLAKAVLRQSLLHLAGGTGLEEQADTIKDTLIFLLELDVDAETADMLCDKLKYNREMRSEWEALDRAQEARENS